MRNLLAAALGVLMLAAIGCQGETLEPKDSMEDQLKAAHVGEKPADSKANSLQKVGGQRPGDVSK